LSQRGIDFLNSPEIKAKARNLRPMVRILNGDLHGSLPPERIHNPGNRGPSPMQINTDGSFVYEPADIRMAYGADKLPVDAAHGGAGQVIAIVDAFGSPTIMQDLDTFSQQFGLPSAAAVLTVVNPPHGAPPNPDPNDPDALGWSVETSLDVEWVHAMAPNAKIKLYVATDESDLMDAAFRAGSDSDVNQVSMSWGADEEFFTADELATMNSILFTQPEVAFVASSGDSGLGASWPASAGRVLAVGGSSLYYDTVQKIDTEWAWTGSGGGWSASEPQPPYQAPWLPGQTTRTIPDVALDADPYTGYLVFDSTLDPGGNPEWNWIVVGGTSASAPQWAAIVALGNAGRKTAQAPLPPLNHSDQLELQTILYSLKTAGANGAVPMPDPKYFQDITQGCFNYYPQLPYFAKYCAGPGYDPLTGLGTPHVDMVVAKLSGS
jgi:subtilase family serine protease